MSEDQSNRDRIRALVRDVLDKLPAEQTSAPAPTDSKPPTIPPLKQAPSQTSGSVERKVTRDESSQLVITGDDVQGLESGAVLRIAEGARLTPLAADIISEKKIEVVRRVSRRGSRTSRIIGIGADHGGFKMKEELKGFLNESGHRVHDFGTHSEEAVDYPDLAHAVAKAVSEGTVDVGIVIDGAGVGSAMTANKVPGVRAAACYSADVARNSREHNDANVLTLGSKTITSQQMREIVSTWLATEISEDRHRKRVSKIEAIERQYQR